MTENSSELYNKKNPHKVPNRKKKTMYKYKFIKITKNIGFQIHRGKITTTETPLS